MDIRSFSRANRARCEDPRGFNHSLESWSLSDWFTATMGELGEAANIAKKLKRVRDGVPGNEDSPEILRQKLASELADTFIYLDLLAQAAGVDLVTAIESTFDAKSEKIGYPVRIKQDESASLGWMYITDPNHKIRPGVDWVEVNGEWQLVQHGSMASFNGVKRLIALGYRVRCLLQDAPKQ